MEESEADFTDGGHRSDPEDKHKCTGADGKVFYFRCNCCSEPLIPYEPYDSDKHESDQAVYHDDNDFTEDCMLLADSIPMTEAVKTFIDSSKPVS